MNTVIQLTELSKRYPAQQQAALDHLTFSVQQGEIFGYLGPNGAGKTTTIRLLLDLIRPDSGSVQVLGMNAQTESSQIRQQVGYLPGELCLWDHMTGREILHYLAGLRPNADLDYAYALAKRLQLKLDIRAHNYSTGNKRKVGIIQAMMHRPRLLIFDEPTTGLDPLMRQTFNALIREASQAGQTVFLSSHVLSEVEATCDRVAILRGGRLRQIHSISALKNSLSRHVLLYSPQLHVDGWHELPGVQQVQTGSDHIRLTVTGSLDAVIKHAAQYQIDDLRIENATLEQLFMDEYDD